MGINNHWRNKQLKDSLLWQEIQCLEFCQQQNTTWAWHGVHNNFFNVCKKVLTFGPNHNGVIIINTPTRLTVDNFVNHVSSVLTSNIQTAYMAINRYEFLVQNTNINLPDSIEQCLDIIANRCNPAFRRLYVPAEVDGKHFVGVHGLDVFVYENN